MHGIADNPAVTSASAGAGGFGAGYPLVMPAAPRWTAAALDGSRAGRQPRWTAAAPRLAGEATAMRGADGEKEESRWFG
ncbi:hypothetical protein CC117_22035 [Parafrankia colletiae]|uniref:Uncharacterized protein n=1 Tax=Parafrankia colletiae TaxID=573497 RepID=A0A1S1QM18_9ACTN|nr:hypothetical protein CC117_22035 [Parafrankia colletiae]